jgi:hypothetical protein
MFEVIKGIRAGDLACIRIGIEFIVEDAKFPFGKTLKSGVARALRRARLSTMQQEQIRRRVFHLLAAGIIPHEYRDYAHLVRTIGIRREDVPEVASANPYARQFHANFIRAAQMST